MYQIGLRLDGQTVVLSSEARIRQAIQRGDLRPDTRVLIEEEDEEVYVGPAGDFPWLGQLFDDLSSAPVIATEAPPKPPVRKTRTKTAPKSKPQVKPPVEPTDIMAASLRPDPPEPQKEPEEAPQERIVGPIVAKKKDEGSGCGCAVLIIIAVCYFLARMNGG